MRFIGKIPFHKLTVSNAESSINSIIDSGAKCHQVVIANAYSVVLAQKNPLFASVCSNAEFVFADGMPIIWISKIYGGKIPERIAGPDFMWSYCGICEKKGYKIFLLGGDEYSLKNLEDSLIKQYPQLNISGSYSPPYGVWSDKENVKIIDKINKSGSNVLWVGVSTPKQDIWIHEHKSKLNVNVAFGVGAAFDFHSGKIKRAPFWMQKAGLEWLYRLSQDPFRLWKRYVFGNLEFILIILNGFIYNRVQKIIDNYEKKNNC